MTSASPIWGKQSFAAPAGGRATSERLRSRAASAASSPESKDWSFRSKRPNKGENTMGQFIVFVVIAIFAMIMISKIVRVVPQQQAWVVERLGKYNETLGAGLHILWPFRSEEHTSELQSRVDI